MHFLTVINVAIGFDEDDNGIHLEDQNIGLYVAEFHSRGCDEASWLIGRLLGLYYEISLTDFHSKNTFLADGSPGAFLSFRGRPRFLGFAD